MTEELKRLKEKRDGIQAWQRWGLYLSERQWGTVREDYSPSGDAWAYLTHEHARSRAYRWGEDGIAGFSDEQQRLCLALALWNGRDPILKERLFGLTNTEGNHGEDVKELYYYLDATPTHSYLKMLYKYPQAGFPYLPLVEENRRRGRRAPEFELQDTGLFDDGRYWDVFVEYAKAGPEDILMLVTTHNCGPDAAILHILPQLWFRNTSSWGYPGAKPVISRIDEGAVLARHPELGNYFLYAEAGPTLLFCENETNTLRLFGVAAPGSFKDAIHDYIAGGDSGAVNPEPAGTKVAAHHMFALDPGGRVLVKLRLSSNRHGQPFSDFDEILDTRRREADEFYAWLQRGSDDEESRRVHRQALAGMIWNKQFYYFDVRQWIQGDPGQPPPPAERKQGRNKEWKHLNNADVLSMPDKWEYPWYAAWDLALQALPLSLVDPDFAKEQLVLLTREWYMQPNGQLPAYEWAFGDVNPPVHAWAAWRVFEIDRQRRRTEMPDDPGDLAFLERVFHKLILNFTWWVNRKDADGRNVFQGGFLGLDNIGILDRSKPFPAGGHIDQADGTAWMAMFSLNLMRIALELARHNHVYEDIATKFFEHFLQIAEAMTKFGEGGISLWDEQDSSFYDVLHLPAGGMIPPRVRSLVGLTPLFAVEVLDQALLAEVPEFRFRLDWFLNHRPDLARLVSRWQVPGQEDQRLLSLLRGHRMKSLLRRMLDETEFLSEYGVRSLSRYHLDHPFTFRCNGQTMTVRYEPGESDSAMLGGNSNWRGPVWFSVNFLIIESLRKFHDYYGDDFKVECPTGSGRHLTLHQIAGELSRRLTRLFLGNRQGIRPVHGGCKPLQSDPRFRDYISFHEYFHGDNGQGLGASHQIGWTSLVANLLQPGSA
jgi:hypothetical protein